MSGDGNSRRMIRLLRLCPLLLLLLPATVQAETSTPVEIVPVTGHQGGVIRVAFSPDGKWLASSGEDRTVKLWETATGRLVRIFAEHSDGVRDVAFSPDGTRLASSDAEGVVRLWDPGSGALIRSFEVKDKRFYVARQAIGFSPDGSMLAVGYTLWDVASGTRIRSFEVDSRTPPQGAKVSPSLAFSPDGRLLVIAGARWQTGLWETATGRLIRTVGAEGTEVVSVAFSPDGALVATGSTDGITRLWETETGQLRGTLERQRATISSIAFSPDGRWIAAADHDWKIVIRDVAAGTIVRTLTGHKDAVYSIAFSPDGQWIASGSADQTFLVWDLETGRPLSRFQKDIGSAHQVLFSPDGRFLASAGTDHTVRLWDRTEGQLLQTLTGHTAAVQAVAFSANGRRLVSGSAHGDLRLWEEGESGLWRQATSAGAIPGSDGVTAVAFLPEDKQIVSGTRGGRIRVHEAATGGLVRGFDAHDLGVLSLSVSPDGLIASGGEDKTVKVWEASTGRLVRTLDAHSNAVVSVAFSPDGALLASGSEDKTVRIWDGRTGHRLHTFEVAWPVGEIFAVAFSRDSTLVAAGSKNGRISFWNAKTGQFAGSIEQAGGRVRTLAFAPDGRALASATMSNYRNTQYVGRVRDSKSDATVKLWKVLADTTHSLTGHDGEIAAIAASADGTLIASAGSDHTVRLWDRATGTLRHRLKGHNEPVKAVAFSPSGSMVASGGNDGLRVWDGLTGERTHTADSNFAGVEALAFSADGLVLAATNYGDIELHHLETGQITRRDGNGESALAFTPDGRFLVSAGLEGVHLRQAATGAVVRTIDGDGRAMALSPDGRTLATAGKKGPVSLWELETGRLIRRLDVDEDELSGFGRLFAYDGRFVAVRTSWQIKVLEAATGRLLHTLDGHPGSTKAFTFLPDPSGESRFIASAGADGEVRIMSRERDRPLVTLFAGRIRGRDEWLALTPDGFFDASDGALDMLAVVRGLETFSVEQVRDQLHRRDLVHERLSGDVLHRYADEAYRLNLQKILESGAAPQIEFLDDRTQRAGDTVRLAVRLFNNEGGGIGERLIWRINGQTQGETEPAALQGRERSGDLVSVTQALRLDPARDNVVTVTAYNGAGLLATLPVRIRIDRFGATATERPRMVILAIGVDSYREPALAPLKLAVNDVRTVARDLKQAAEAGGYRSAEIVERLETEATRAGIAAAFADIAARMKRQDTLIVLLAGHGKSSKGRYYYLPSDTRFGGGRDLSTEGIEAESWQRWIASVQVDKKLLIIDTCESSEAITLVRGSGAALVRETAVERLRQAVGHSVITAARDVAYETSSLGHGILSYAVLESLRRKPPSGGLIDVKAIDSHVAKAVPRLSVRLSGERQEPYNKIVGNFPIGAPLSEAGPEPDLVAIQPGDYAVFGTEPIAVRTKPDAGAEVAIVLELGTKVQVFAFLPGGWTLIGRQGIRLGYVPSSAVISLKE